MASAGVPRLAGFDSTYGLLREGYAFVPQRAGDPALTHRRPGEGATVTLMVEAVRQLTRGMRYEVQAQDLARDLRHIPAGPPSGLVISAVRARDGMAAAAGT